MTSEPTLDDCALIIGRLVIENALLRKQQMPQPGVPTGETGARDAEGSDGEGTER